MKVCYVVYREDNVFVFESQVLEYVQNLKKIYTDLEVEIILFRHEENMFRKKNVENKILKYADKCKTFWSLPLIFKGQLNINALRLKKYIRKKYNQNEKVIVFGRGDLATFVSAKAFDEYKKSKVVYDNRGLPIEESKMSYHNSFIHMLNRRVKKYAILYSKSHCDMYNFVTSEMRNFLVENYQYDKSLTYTIIPTLCRENNLDYTYLNTVKKNENITDDDFVISYIGSAAAWQSSEKVLELISKISDRFNNAKFFILTKDEFSNLDSVPSHIRERITIKGVKHSDMKYYLAMTDVGIVLRDNNIVNRVAAPTKIAEYLVNGLSILYSGEIGILEDVKNIVQDNYIIDIEKNVEWLEMLDELSKRKTKKISEEVINYFDMSARQKEIMNKILNEM